MTHLKFLMRTIVCAALATGCALTLSGCVLIPVPTALADPEPFTPETLSAIVVGGTTQNEVRTLFADWNYTTDDGLQTAHIAPQISDDGRYWAFGLPRQMGDIAFAGLVLYFPVPIPVLKGVEDNYQNYWVLVEFDAAGVVVGFQITRVQAPCVPGGVCYRNGRLLVLANETDASYMAGGDRCAVYTYARKDFDEPAVVGSGSELGQVFGKTTFLRSEITVGQSTISASIEGSAETAVDVSLTCAGGETHYVELNRIKNELVAIQAEASTGAREVAKRFRVERVVQVGAPPDTPEAIEAELNTGLGAPILSSEPDTAPAALGPLPPLGPDATAADVYRRAQALVARRDPAAWPLLCKGAAAGDARAQMELGFWQRADLAVPSDFTEPLDKDNRLAYVWYRLAELNGGGGADARHYIRSGLTAEERVEADAMVREWWPSDCPLRTIRQASAGVP